MAGLKLLLTGAGGFVGSAVRQCLSRDPRFGRLLLVDRFLPQEAPGDGTWIAGDLADRAVLDRIAGFAPDVTLHLAALPGGAAESDYEAGRRANLDASLALFEQLARLRPGGRAPVVVYASSIAVYGTRLPAVVRPDTPLHPPLTYGAHKRVCEILLADFARRGVLDARSLRLPGMVARRSAGPGLASAFMSELLHTLSQGRPYTVPVSEGATAWWMSARRCAENLLHAATMDVTGTDPGRAWPLPVLRLSMGEVVAAGAGLFGEDRRDCIDYRPDAALEAVFGRYPELDDREARALGLRDDGSAQALLLRAVGRAPELEPETP